MSGDCTADQFLNQCNRD